MTSFRAETETIGSARGNVWIEKVEGGVNMEARPSPTPAAPRAEARPTSPIGGFVEHEGETCYRIRAFHRLDPFLVSLPSDTDLWMFVASGGGLTAGRGDAENSLFPYRPVDQLHDAHHHTGPLTLLQVSLEGGQRTAWRPFAEDNDENADVERNLYKNVVGNRLVFEEVQHELGLAFRHRWSGCDEYGWVRTATLENRGPKRVRVSLLDGLRNVLPYGAPLALYQQASSLVDAYRRSEVEPESDVGIFSLTSRITDRAEALEVLRANVVWCCGLEGKRVHLSSHAVEEFRAGRMPAEESVREGGRGNYLVSTMLELEPGESVRWHLICDTGLDHASIVELRRRILAGEDLGHDVEEALDQATESLRRNVASADGLQLSAQPESWSHHFANVLYNNMRGGVFLHGYQLPTADLEDFLRRRNRRVAERHQDLLAGLPETTTIQEVLRLAGRSGDADLQRLCHEYLPLYFGRRHGDPSRPWNHFSIRGRGREGEQELHYEGNWRDIFQNWEALATAFPGFLPSMVAKFVNASTVDGFNPYRITREGVDWETADPDDPWSNIGYWGDHQIVYLLKLLEAMDRHDPEAVARMLEARIFSYADVPYRIQSYEEILADCSSTIEFDHERAAGIEDRVEAVGSDGRLLTGPDGGVLHVNLLEKLLVPTLSKLSNLVPGAGIWMNTQRPEWNDANNVLAGGGVSVVTLCYLRRHLLFLAERLAAVDTRALPVSAEVVEWFTALESVLESEQEALARGPLDGRDRRRIMDALGGAFSTYREGVYEGGLNEPTELELRRVVRLCQLALRFVDRGIAENRRADGLFHTYNLLEIASGDGAVELQRLPEMLEGQVAVLSSGFLRPEESLEVLEALFESELYRSDQHSFMLYPEKKLSGFLEKNVVPTSRVEGDPLLRGLAAADEGGLVEQDADGNYRFHGDLRNAADVEEVLDRLAEREKWAEAVERSRPVVLELFEEVFHHRSYTGRSGVMYGYEGLGCIYWHMVAKLLLAAQEQVLRARRDGLAGPVREGLARAYFRVRGGLGYEKTVTEFGAFPTDPYSHTPPGGGAKQPGMTGQVKEEILTRMGELGVEVLRGTVRFRPTLLRASELLERPTTFHSVDVDGEAQEVELPAHGLAFTFCQVPVVYERVEGEGWVRVVAADGSTHEHSGCTLDAATSAEVFSRGGRIARIHVGVREQDLCRV